MFNKKIDEKLSKTINRNFFEVIVAPKFDNKALLNLKSKKNSIIINSSNLKNNKKIEFKSVISGTLFQESNSYKNIKLKTKLVTKKKCSKKIIDDLLFAFKVVKHVKSNAIVLVNNKQTLGIGAGQMSRIDSTKIAILKYKNFFKNKTFVCASDAFFPFTDNIKLLLKLNCKGIIQPSGSKNDQKIIEYANKNNASLYFVKYRAFKH